MADMMKAGAPLFSTNFLYNGVKRIRDSSMDYFGDRTTDADRLHMRQTLLASHHNVALILLHGAKPMLNVNRVSPYADSGFFTGAYDAAKLDKWIYLSKELVSVGLYPFYFMFGDDSPEIASAFEKKPAAVDQFIQGMAGIFYKYAAGFALGLEINEWCRNASLVNHYGTILAKAAVRPDGYPILVGNHETGGSWKYSTQSWTMCTLLQYGFGKSGTAAPATMTKLTAACLKATKKPVIACEYSMNGESKEADAAARAALGAGASACFNGMRR